MISTVWLATLLAALLIGCSRSHTDTPPNRDEETTKLSAQVDSLRALLSEFDSSDPSFDSNAEFNAKYWREEAARARKNQGMLLSRGHERRLKQAGLQDPAEEIRNSLLSNDSVLRPYDRNLRMFFVPDRIVILSDRWVYAGFEDGHMGGDCLLEFDVTDSSVVSWQILESTISPAESPN